ncbi:MAG TPA: TM2 domain-containing protein [Pyrinomonadaceae bacterium]
MSKSIMPVFCTKCGFQNDEYTQTCLKCQAPLPTIGGYQPIQPPAPVYGQQAMQDWKQMGADKKIAAGICGILIGSLGIHKFVLGYQREGVIMLLVSLLTCGIGAPIMSIIGIVEGVMYLTKPDEEFVRTYIQGRKGWF